MKHAKTWVTVAVATSLALAACGNDTADAPGTGGMTMSPSETSTAAAPDASATAAEGENNDADVMFAQMMIPHHAQAIEMSDMIMAKDDVDQEVLDLAAQIKDAQGPEIAQMTGWLEGWGAEVPEMGMGMGGVDMGSGSRGGMMSEEDMQALEDAEGAQAATLFLEQMVQHHTGAIEMAQAQVENGQNSEAIELAESIIDSQQEEIMVMEDLLATQ